MRKRFVLRYGARQLQTAAAEAVKLRGGPDLTRPMHVRAVVNDLCNYRCRYCEMWRLPQERRREEMSIEGWKRALSSVRDLTGWTVVQFSGGEPFIKKGFVDLLEWCRDHEIPWGVITNGSALNEKISRRVVEARPTNFDISLDAPVADINDYVRGRDGAFDRIVRGIGYLTKFREETGINFPIRLKPVVTLPSMPYLTDMVKLTEKLGVDFVDFNALREWDNPGVTNLHIREPADLAKLERQVEELIAMKRAGAPIETSEDRLRALIPHSAGDVTFSGVAPCRVGMRELHIRPNGDVEVCWFFDTLGNLRDMPAKQLWNSPRARKIREETVSCDKFGTIACANSCLTHRTVKQQVQRGLDMVTRSSRLRVLAN